MCDAAPQQSYATFAAHQARLHTPTRLALCYPATIHSLQMARDRITDALYDLNTPMKTIARWLTYIDEAACDMDVDEIWAWAVLDWSELVLALDDDDVSWAFTHMSSALHARGMDCGLDDAILDAFQEAHCSVQDSLKGKQPRINNKLTQALKSWWSTPQTLITNGNLANGNPLLGQSSDAVPAYPNYQRFLYRSVVMNAWQLATEQRIEMANQTSKRIQVEEEEEEEEFSINGMDTIAEEEDDVELSCVHTCSSMVEAQDSESPEAPVDDYSTTTTSPVIKEWPMEPLCTGTKDSWNVMELLCVQGPFVYRASWLERCNQPPVQEQGNDTKIDGPTGSSCDLVSQRRHSDADSLCSLTTNPLSEDDEEDYEEYLDNVPAPLATRMPMGKGCAPPDTIFMMDDTLRASVFKEEEEGGVDVEFTRLVSEIQRRRLVSA